jgi:leucyl aminopeptidase
VRTLNETGGFDGTLYLTELSVRKRDVAWRVRQAVIIAEETLYRFDQLKSKKDEVRRPLRKLTFCVERRSELALAEQAMQEGQAVAAGMIFMKNLANLPGNICTPTYLAEQARSMASEHSLEVEVLGPAEMEQLGMHSLLAVAKGSHQPPQFIILKHLGGKLDDKPVVLVGKGVTFDTAASRSSPRPRWTR